MIRWMAIVLVAGLLGAFAAGCGRYGPPLRSNTGGENRPYWAQTPAPPPEPEEEEAAAAPSAEPNYVRGAELDGPEETVEP